MPRYPAFVGGSATSQSVLADGEQTINWYVEQMTGEAATAKNALYPTPGFQGFILAGQITDLGTRAGIAINGRTFVVVGTGFYELFGTHLATKRGTVAQDNNLAQIVSNGVGNQLLIGSGGNAYCFELATNTLTQILTNEVTQIGMLNSTFLAFNAALSKIRISDLNDGLSWDPTQFAQRSAQPDPWKAMIVNSPDIFLIGEQTGDVWYDSGASPFPLAPRQGLTLGYGIVAGFSLAFTGGVGFWLTQNKDGAGMVVQTRGYSPQKISTPELDTAIARYQRDSIITDAEALVYQDQGHTFYVLRFPAANATWAYDLTTNSWAERGKWNAALNRYDVWWPRVHLYAFGSHLVGDAATGTIAAMDVTYPSEADGSAIRRLRRGAPLMNDQRRMPIKRFELLLETGLGVQSGQGSDPQVMFRGSSDGGKTWGTQRQASAGAVGKYDTRVFWTRLGSPRIWVPEVTVADPVPWRLIDAFLNN